MGGMRVLQDYVQFSTCNSNYSEPGSLSQVVGCEARRALLSESVFFFIARILRTPGCLFLLQAVASFAVVPE